MFGNVATPSPAISVEAEIEGTWQPVIKILGCLPKDTSDLPLSVIEKWPTYGEGCTDSACVKCGREVVLGPRQAIAYDLAPEEYMVCCLICVTAISILYGGKDKIALRHFGGE